MPLTVGTREELEVAVEASVRPGEPTRVLAIFRVAGFDGFTKRYGDQAIETLAMYISFHLPLSGGTSAFYYRPRKDELAALIEDAGTQAEEALASACREINDNLRQRGVTVGYGLTILPFETASLLQALTLADRQITDAEGKPLPRSFRPDFLELRANVQSTLQVAPRS
jgi:hypothetical protein